MTISLIFDIAIAAILLLCLIVGGVRGFISSLLSVAVFAAALLGSAILANALADSVSDWLTPRVEQYVLDRLTNGHGHLDQPANAVLIEAGGRGGPAPPPLRITRHWPVWWISMPSPALPKRPWTAPWRPERTCWRALLPA